MPTLNTINIGASPNDGTGDSIRDAFSKVRDNFNTIETTLVPTLITQEVANINAVFTGGTISNATTITDGTNSTNSSTGALTIVGGIGVGGSANFASSITSPTVTATTITGDLTGDVTGNVTGNVTGDLTGNVNGTTVTASGAIVGDSATITNAINATDITLTNQLIADSIISNSTLAVNTSATIGGLLTVDSINADTGVTVATGNVTLTTGNVNVNTGSIFCVNTGAGNGEINGRLGRFGFGSMARGQVGQSGGSGTVGNPNYFTIYTEDGTMKFFTAAAPASSTDTGEVGEIRFGEDSGTYYLYYCHTANTWVRTAFSSF